MDIQEEYQAEAGEEEEDKPLCHKLEPDSSHVNIKNILITRVTFFNTIYPVNS